ncbi:MAG: hypothetical protein EOM02_01330 [Synergistales bacterium]|nr:hypothetical protein [Synergistales bacterium]
MKVFLTVFGKPRYLGLVSESETPVLVPGEPVVVQTSRGEEIAKVAGEISGEQADFYVRSNEEGAKDGVQNGEPGLQTVVFVRQATEEDIVLDEENRVLEEDVLLGARRLLGEHGLAMKIVDVEYLLDRKKLFFYFTSEQRVDFRAYVRDLAREFRTRIELRQIGVRDEAKVVKGIAPCGRPCCCSYWLHAFMPIGIKMVKEQNLALNPSKISGLCGRLMCCMSYEHNVYRELWKDLPNPGSKVKGPKGNFLMLGVDVKEGSALMRAPDGAHFSVEVALFDQFREKVAAGEDWAVPSIPRSNGQKPVPPIHERERPQDKASPRHPARKVQLKDQPVAEQPQKEAERDDLPLEDGVPKKNSRRRRKKKKPINLDQSQLNQVDEKKDTLDQGASVPVKKKRRRRSNRKKDVVSGGEGEK